MHNQVKTIELKRTYGSEAGTGTWVAVLLVFVSAAPEEVASVGTGVRGGPAWANSEAAMGGSVSGNTLLTSTGS
jgi:hypothetical protein